MSIEKSVIVDDSTIEELGRSIEVFLKELKQFIDRYAETINKIEKNALISGAAADAFSLYSSYVQSLKIMVDEMGNGISETCNFYISEIDRTDQFV